MITLSYGLILTSILFVLGLTAIIIRRNLIFILLGLEIMINASALAFIMASNHWGQVDGHIMYILVITSTSVETSIFLSLLLKLYRCYHNLNINILGKVN